MQFTGLSLDQAPPISVPIKFFLCAPLFGMAAAVLLFFQAEEILASRWTMASLAFVHLIVLGFVCTNIFGALQQMLPVVATASIPKPVLTSNVLLLSWIAGTTLLVGGFLSGQIWMFLSATVCLLIALTVIILAVALSLKADTVAKNATVHSIKISLFLGFAVTVLLGLSLSLGHAQVLPLYRHQLTNIHASFGLIGWFFILIAGIAYQVVPMFQITSPYPVLLQRWLAIATMGLIIVRSLYPLVAIDILISFLLTTFMVFTLWLQKNRRRKIPDISLMYWKFGVIFISLSLVCYFLNFYEKIFGGFEHWDHLVFLFFVMGFVVAIICGMLNKIVSFLVWFHLQAFNTERCKQGLPSIAVPNMKTIISNQSTKYQQYVYLASIALSLAMFWVPQLSYATACLWFCCFLMLEFNLVKAYLRYRQTIYRITN